MIELIVHGAIAALGTAAAFALWTGSPAAQRLGVPGVILVGAAAIQSQFVSWLPRQTVPGEQLPVALAHGVFAGAWLVWLRRQVPLSR